MAIADQIALMDHGVIAQVGSPRELYDSPASPFVMGFLGPVTVLSGRQVRPHDLVLARDAALGGQEAMVVRHVHLGFEVRVELQLAGGEQVTVHTTRGRAEELELADGDILFVRDTGAVSA